MKALILINFKTYKEAVGDKAILLAKQFSKVNKNKYEIAISPSLLNLREIAKTTKIPVYAQHCDYQPLGAHTGHILPEELKLSCATGTILNHSERKIPLEDLKATISVCKKNKLKTIVCTSTLLGVKVISKLNPNYIAYEPKKLIGGNVSVTSAKPKIIQQAVRITKKYSNHSNLLVGAGVHSGEDLQTALKLGAKGVLLSHAAVQAKDPQKFLETMLK